MKQYRNTEMSLRVSYLPLKICFRIRTLDKMLGFFLTKKKKYTDTKSQIHRDRNSVNFLTFFSSFLPFSLWSLWFTVIFLFI